MFDIAPSEFVLFALVALIVIGPKDLPKAMRVVGRFVGKARGMANQFRSGFDAMVREAELEEMEKKWKEENARIMAEHSSLSDFSDPAPAPLPADPEIPSANHEQPALPAPAEKSS
jgi:sec-independent protein translocase protein TatB